MVIDTGKVKDRRVLHFESPREMMADVERIVASETAGTLRRTGNWTAGQIFGHLATWNEFPYDGYPPELRPPWFIKLVLRMQKKRFVVGTMPIGVKIPRISGGTYGVEPLSLEEGLSRLRKSWGRLERTPPTLPNPIFGPTTHGDWIAMNLRHAELHLGFLHP